jgi:hypothetical protein
VRLVEREKCMNSNDYIQKQNKQQQQQQKQKNNKHTEQHILQNASF